jgi:molybdate transport system substrate-binding protein
MKGPALSGPKGWLAFGALAIALLTAACESGEGASDSSSGELLVAAAADLQYAFDEVGALFEEETGAKVTFSYGSSGMLAQQIEGGLPADLYSSANVEYVDRLRDKGLLIEDTQQVYAVGRLALAASTQAGVAVSELEDLLRPEVEKVAIADPGHAPYGRAAEEALRSADLWDELKPKLVYGQNIGAATEYVRSGNAEAGLVALSLVIQEPAVTYVTVDEGLHQPIQQALAVVKGTKNEELARRFVAFVRGPEGRAVLEKYGFVVPEEG